MRADGREEEVHSDRPEGGSPDVGRGQQTKSRTHGWVQVKGLRVETSAPATWVAWWRAEWYGRNRRVGYEEKDGTADGSCPSGRGGDGKEGKYRYRARVAGSAER